MNAAVAAAVLVLVVPVTSAVTAAAWAQSPTFNGNGQVQRGDCQGGDTVVNGNRNQITLTGYCRRVTVLGNENRILVEMTSGGHISIPGNSNVVEYRLPPGGTAPAQSVFGSRNEVRQAAGTSATPQRRGGVSGREP